MHPLFKDGPEEARRKAELAHDIVEQHTDPVSSIQVSLEKFVRDNLGLSLAGGVAAGLLLGYLIGRR